MMEDISAFASHNTSSVKSALKRFSVSLPHRPHAHRSSSSRTTTTTTTEQTKPELDVPPSKRAPCINKTLKTPAEQQLEVIDLVCHALDERMDNTTSITDAEYVCFQGPKQPEISVRDYIIRLVKYANNFCEDVPRANSSGIRSLLIAMEYLERCGAVINQFTVHRYLLISVLVAIKTLEDYVMEGSYWGAVGGCTVPELNLYERQFLLQLRFRCHVSQSQFNQLSSEFGCPFDWLSGDNE